MKQETRTKLNNVLKGLILSKEQKAELIEVFEEVGGGNKNNIYYLYNKYEDGQINWYNTDNKLLFTTSDNSFIEFNDIDDITFENYFNCSVNDFHDTYDKIIITDLDNDRKYILNKCVSSYHGYSGIMYMNVLFDKGLLFMISRTTDSTNYITVRCSLAT